MQFRTTGLLLLGAMALPASGTAQTTPAPPAITRTVVAATKLPTVTDVPLHFKAVSITLQPDEKSGVSAANGILYQLSGSTEVALDGEAKMLNAGDGLFIAGGKTAALTAGSGGPSTFLHFSLVSVVDLGRPAETAPAAVRELYRTANPIPDLKPGGYSSSAELARAEKVNDSYLSRILRLTLIAPGIIEAIVTGRQPSTLQLDDLLKPLPAAWALQYSALFDPR